MNYKTLLYAINLLLSMVALSGVNFDKLGFFSKKMLQMVKNNLKKEAEDEEAIEMIQRLSISKSYVNKESIQPLLREVEKFTHNS